MEDLYLEMTKKYAFRVTWRDFVTTTFGLWIDILSNADYLLHSSGQEIEKELLLHIG